MDYDESKIRSQVIAGLKAQPWQVEMESIDYGEKCGVFYRSASGVKRAAVPTRDQTENQIAFALLFHLMNEKERIVVGDCPDDTFGAAVIVAVGPLNINGTNDYTNTINCSSPYEGKRGKHPNNCTCSKHKVLDGQAA